jgi:hypothetical protein
VSGAVLDVTRARRRPRELLQPPLFDDLRRAAPPSPRSDPPTVRAEPAAAPSASGERPPRSGGGRLTLEVSLERAWEDLLAAGAAACVVCGDELEWTQQQGSCRGCGSRIA